MQAIKTLRPDLLGGLTCAVVALPLALAFGVSSGAGAIAGVYGAIVLGFFAALFGGTTRQISGPTGPMTVVMAAVLVEFQAKYPDSGLAIAFTTVMLAGVIQVLLGFLKLGRFFVLVPYVVISGFMSGIGLIIIILELQPLLGLHGESSVVQSMLTLPSNLSHMVWQAFVLGLLSLAIVFFWPQKLRGYVPSPLAALIIGTLFYLVIFQGDTSVLVVGEIPSGLPELQWPSLEWSLLPTILYSAILLAVLGAIDSLLTSLVADRLTHTQHDPNRELIGQGIGNFFAGFVGGLPGAGATMRTVVNINAGSKTRLSGVVHSLVLLFLILGASPLAEHIPHAVLAGILIKVGVDIMDWHFMARIRQMPLFTIAIMFLVMLVTVFYDLITAVLISSFITNLVTIDRLTRSQISHMHTYDGRFAADALGRTVASKLVANAGKIVVFKVVGDVSFGDARKIPEMLQHHHGYECLIFDISEAHLVGLTAPLQLDEVIRQAEQQQVEVLLVGLPSELALHQKLLRVDRFEQQGRVFGSLELAVDHCLKPD